MKTWRLSLRLVLAIVGMAGVALVVALVLVGDPWRLAAVGRGYFLALALVRLRSWL